MKGHGSISAWCVNHPIATVLLTFALILLGCIAFPRLPVAPLPEAEFPTIQVSATLPGASPETMASSVATPLEEQFSAIPGITQMTSTPPPRKSRRPSTPHRGDCPPTCRPRQPGARSTPPTDRY